MANISTTDYYISRFGYTLIELIIVLAIVGTVVSMSIPFISDFLFRANLESSAEDIVSTLMWARRLAITKRGEYRVIFNPGKGKYWLEDKEGNIIGERRSLQENIVFANPELNKKEEEDGIVEFDHPDDSGFSFYPQGTAESGSIYLRGKESEKWHTITITASTGYARIYPEKH
jgi:prepilin-type N-terminal cleavage/methylation domain-containing protein